MTTPHRPRSHSHERLGISPVVLFLAIAALWLVLVAGLMIGFSPSA